MKTSYIGSVVVGLMSLLTCAAQARCIEVNSVNTPGDANAVFVISQPGSYCLQSNVVGVAARMESGSMQTVSRSTLAVLPFLASATHSMV